MLNILSILITVVKVATPAAETGFFAGLLAGLMVPWVLYLLTFLGIIALIYTHETKEIGWSHTLFILITAYLCFYFKVSWRDLIYNPIPLLKWVGIYLLFGTGWSFFKWYFYLKNLLSEFNEKKEAIKKDLSNDARFKDDKLFKSEMYEFKVEIRSELACLESRLDRKISDVAHHQTKMMGGMTMGAVALMTLIDRYLPPNLASIGEYLLTRLT